MVFNSKDYSELSGSLATVAIASLGGPMPAVGAALAAVVRHAQARYEATAPTRGLHRKVSSGIRKWAESEKDFTTDEVNRGLALGVESVQRFGLDVRAIADLNFDPENVSEQVIDRAKTEDRYWGTEDHYKVASRAIRETYHILIEQYRATEKVLLPAIQALRDSIDDFTSRTVAQHRTTTASLDDLVATLIEAGTAAEMMEYLRIRIADWDRSRLQGQRKSSAVERPMRVRTSNGQEVTAEDALAGQRTLVVLGGPGSGKTQLARHFAREAALAALSRLEDGVDLDEVELPLFTTWAQWTKTSGSLRQSLVTASFNPGLGHSDLNWGDSIDRIQRTFTRQGTKVLLILDSLDEAADLAGQASRLYEVGMISGWRVVVTCRPAAWDATYRGDPRRDSAPTIVNLQDLSYPADVDAFIRTWFAMDPSRGDALIKQIRDRSDLAQVAVIPLMLTFYCLLTEPPALADHPLPAHRQVLYRRLVKRLLVGGWVSDTPNNKDVDYCVSLLTDWAWHAVKDDVTPSGLGNWGESFQQSTQPLEGQRRAIDNVAPKVMDDDEGQLTRRFVHRTILEHLVAEHIATLEADEAADILLPHLWFDQDWEVVAPDAIAAHNRRQKGALLEHLLPLLGAVGQPAKDLARQAASSEIDRLLLAIAEQSEPKEWIPNHEVLIRSCWERNAAHQAADVVRTTPWAHSNQEARSALLTALPAADPWSLPFLVKGLLALGPTEDDRAEVRTALLTALPAADQWSLPFLVKTLLALEPTEDDRAEVRTALLTTALPAADPSSLPFLVEGLLALGPTEDDRAEARTALLTTALLTADPSSLPDLVEALLALGPTEGDRAEVRTALLTTALLTADPSSLPDIVEALLALEPTEGDRAEARTALLTTALPAADPSSLPYLVEALLALEPTEGDRAEARTALLTTALPAADPSSLPYLVEALLALEPTEGDRAEARTALTTALLIAATSLLSDLVEALLALEPTEGDRAEARTAFLTALLTADPSLLSDLVEALLALEPTEGDRAEARTALTTALLTADPSSLSSLVEALLALEPTEGDRAEARTALLTALPAADTSSLLYVVEALLGLEPTEGDRAEARTALLTALPAADTSSLLYVVEALLGLEPTEGDRAEARTAFLTALLTADTSSLSSLVEALLALEPTEGDRAEARTAFLTALLTADTSSLSSLVEALLALEPTEGDRAEARTALLTALPAATSLSLSSLVEALLALEPTEDDRAKARTALLTAIASASPLSLYYLVEALLALGATEHDHARARTALLIALPIADPLALPDLVAELRSVSPIESWQAWLADLS